MDDNDADAAVDGARRGAATFDPSLSTATIGAGGGGIDVAANDDDDDAAAAAALLLCDRVELRLRASEFDATDVVRLAATGRERCGLLMKLRLDIGTDCGALGMNDEDDDQLDDDELLVPLFSSSSLVNSLKRLCVGMDDDGASSLSSSSSFDSLGVVVTPLL